MCLAFACIYTCAPHVCMVPAEASWRCSSPWNRFTDGCDLLPCAASAVNLRALSPASLCSFFFLNPFVWHLLSSLHMWVNSFINFQIGAVILKLLLTLSVDFFEKVDTAPWSRDALLCKLQLSWPLHLGVVVLSWPAEIVGSAWVGSCDSSGNFSGDELPDLICVFWHRPCCCLEGHCPLFISRFRQEDSSFDSGLIFRLLIQWDRPFLRFW